MFLMAFGVQEMAVGRIHTSSETVPGQIFTSINFRSLGRFIQVANIVKIFTPRNKYVYGSPLLVNRMYTLNFKQQHLFPSDGDVISSAVTVLRVYALCGPHYRDIART